MGLEYFGLKINKDIKVLNFENKVINNDYKSPSVNKEELTPKTRSKMKKIKSEEDFVKFHVPWIL